MRPNIIAEAFSGRKIPTMRGVPETGRLPPAPHECQAQSPAHSPWWSETQKGAGQSARRARGTVCSARQKDPCTVRRSPLSSQAVGETGLPQALRREMRSPGASVPGPGAPSSPARRPLSPSPRPVTSNRSWLSDAHQKDPAEGQVQGAGYHFRGPSCYESDF